MRGSECRDSDAFAYRMLGGMRGVYVNHSTQGENIGGKIQPLDDSEVYLNIVPMTHVSRELETVVSIDHTVRIPKNHILKRSFMDLTPEEEEEREGTKIVQSDM